MFGGNFVLHSGGLYSEFYGILNENTLLLLELPCQVPFTSFDKGSVIITHTSRTNVSTRIYAIFSTFRSKRILSTESIVMVNDFQYNMLVFYSVTIE